MTALTTLRTASRVRGLSIAVVFTLALGTAALCTAFGVVNAALWRAPPFPEAGSIALLYIQRNPADESPRRERWSYPRFQMLREGQRSFEDVAIYSSATLTVSGTADAESVHAESVSASYFPLLRVRAEEGRVFTDAEDDEARPTPVAVLGHGLWTRRFGADPGVIGRPIRLNGTTLNVVGVLPPGFSGLTGKAEVWVPATMSPQLTYAEYLTTNQNFLSAFGRLRSGIELTQAESELALLGAAINRAIPSDPNAPEERASASASTLNDERVDETVRRSLFVLLGAVALLHLLACANVINMLLGQAAARRREAAVRIALGSSGGRLFRLFLSESLAPSLLGGTLGIALSVWITGLVALPTNVWAPRNFYGSLAPFDSPSFGGAELAFGFALVFLTAFLVSIPPAISAFGIDVSSAITSGSRSIAGGGFSLRRPSPRGAIVGLEAALAMLLVVTAGLLIGSFGRMQKAGLGVEPDNVLTFWVRPSSARVPPEAAPAFVSRILDAVASVPGVVSASVDGGGPLSGTASSTLYVKGRPAPAPGQAPPVLRHYIGPDHFRTLGIPLLRGRSFSASDTADAPRATVISESAARRFWPNQDPLGQRVWFGGGSFDSPERSAVIVGIVGDVVYAPLDQRPNFASFYTPYSQFTYASRMVFVRTAGDPWSLVPGVRKAVAFVDPELALRDVRPLTEVVSGSWARHRFDALIFGAFGLAALLLSASGIFAVLSFAVASRTHEFGVRIALGANTAQILRHVVSEGMAYPVAGLMVGVAAALGVTRLLQASLYEISPQEPLVFLGTAALLVITAVAACLVPAWRATRSDPMEALRAE